MYIWNSLVDKIVDSPKLIIEYGGTYNADAKNPLYGRHAYWRLTIEGTNFFAKVTAPVKSINPNPATLDRLLRAEVKRRIEAINEVVETDHYGKVYIVKRDPCSIRGILALIEDQYVDLMPTKVAV